MSKGISNLPIEKAFKELNSQDIDENFVAVFPAKCMNRFIDYKTMISEKKKKKGKYPFIKANTDSDGKGSTHWWSIIDIEPKIDLLL